MDFRALFGLMVILTSASALKIECPSEGKHNLPHPESSDMYVDCDSGIAYEYRCPEGLTYNLKFNKCILHNILKEQVNIVEVNCPLETFTLLPHPSDCSRFYACLRGIAMIQECPAGTHFNDILLKCQNSDFANCIHEPLPPSTPIDCQGIIWMSPEPYPENCSKYYICIEEKVEIYECPSGMNFDSEKLHCISSAESNCISNGVNIVEVVCPLENDALVAHPTSCSLFYTCSNGLTTLEECPTGTHFNDQLMKCQSPLLAYCDRETLPPTQTAIDCQANTWMVPKPHPENCSKFYVCVDGVAEEFNCPSGLEFSPDTLECVWP